MNEEELEVTEYEVSASLVGEGVDLFLAEDSVSDYSEVVMADTRDFYSTPFAEYTVTEGLLLLATKALEALTGLGDLFAQMIETVLGFFGGFIDFLSAMFPFLPEETITILNLGLSLMIAAAVFNRFFK